MKLGEKQVVVVGGSRGLGLGIVEAMREQRAKVTVVARDRARRCRASSTSRPRRARA